LVTGGAGYIGTHACVELLSAGHEVVVIDNLQNSSRAAIERVSHITGATVPFFHADIRDSSALDRIFATHRVDSVMHFAGLKAVGESVAKPLAYYENNVGGTLTLLEAMGKRGVHSMVFSSSATVYGSPESVPIQESAGFSAANPYGRTKVMIEEILRDLAEAQASWRVAVLRYFNPVGAHESGLIGEDPKGIPNNLMPFISQVAVGRREYLSVWGNDYDTPDGTGVRDYIHVVDLARGHVAALKKLEGATGILTYNLGTGHGQSVLDMVRAFEQASGRKIPYSICERRPGDIPTCYADPGKAQRELGWTATKDVLTMCHDSWRWQSQNPNGYRAAGEA
jgi:UDP-glucose 4-epimerase